MEPHNPYSSNVDPCKLATPSHFAIAIYQTALVVQISKIPFYDSTTPLFIPQPPASWKDKDMKLYCAPDADSFSQWVHSIRLLKVIAQTHLQTHSSCVDTFLIPVARSPAEGKPHRHEEEVGESDSKGTFQRSGDKFFFHRTKYT